jgi:hypothetical protein
MDKELKILVDRLDRIFPHLKLWYEGESFLDPFKKQDLYSETQFAPPHTYDWYDIIKILKDNGLEIKNIK